MHVGAGSGKLRHGLKTLRVRWENSEDGWRDSIRQEFENKRIVPLESQATTTLRAMQTLCDVLSRIYRECS